MFSLILCDSLFNVYAFFQLYMLRDNLHMDWNIDHYVQLCFQAILSEENYWKCFFPNNVWLCFQAYGGFIHFITFNRRILYIQSKVTLPSLVLLPTSSTISRAINMKRQIKYSLKHFINYVERKNNIHIPDQYFNTTFH